MRIGVKAVGYASWRVLFLEMGEYNPKRSFIKVLRNREFAVHVPVLDVGCDPCGGEEKCVKYCPSSCIGFVDARKAALIREESKIGKFPAPLIGGL